MIVVRLPIRVNCERNARGNRFALARRTKEQRAIARMSLPPMAPWLDLPLTIHFARYGKRLLDKDDNLRDAFKALKDGVADWLGRDDADESLTWLYSQEIAAEYSVRIAVSKTESRPIPLPQPVGKCDMFDGPCACGGWHKPGDWRIELKK